MKKYLAILMTIFLLLGLGACNNDKKPASDSTAGEGKLSADQTYNSFLSAEPSTLDPGKASDNYAITVIMATQEPLIGIRDDENGNLTYTNECAAESWEISEDGLTYTFHLRPNKWSDGVDVTANDYVYGILRNIDPETGCPYAYFLSPIKGADAAMSGEDKLKEVGISATDDHTLVIELEEATPHFLSVLGTNVAFAMRQDIVEEFGSEALGSEADKIVFNGAHKVVEWTHNSKIVLEKNEHYWNFDKVNYTTVNMPIVNDTNALMNMFYTGEVRSVSTNLAEWREKFEQNSEVIHVQRNNPQTLFMTFNCLDELFQNEKIRRAFSAALDREDFNKQIWDGNNTPATGWVPQSIYVGETNYIENAPKFIPDMIDAAGDPKALLEEGLKELGRDEKPEDLTISLILGSTDQWFKNFGEYLQQRFKQILGVQLDVAQMDWPVFQDRVMKGEYQLGYMGWGSETPEPIAMLSLHLSDSNQLGTGWKNEEFDQLVQQAEREQDTSKRLDLYVQAEQILMNECPVAPVVFTNSNMYRYNNIHDVDYNAFGNMGYRIGYITD